MPVDSEGGGFGPDEVPAVVIEQQEAPLEPAPPEPTPDPAPPPPAAKPAPPQPVIPYNPQGYVPGGSSPAVGQAIEAQAIATPSATPVEVPAAIEQGIPPSTEVTTPAGQPETLTQAETAGPPAPITPSTPGVPLPVGNFNHDELAVLWDKAGGPADKSDVAAAIALAESGGNPGAIDNTAYSDQPHYHAPAKGNEPEYSVGLWQVNVLAHRQYSDAALLVPIKNADAAVAISNHGQDFSAWSTYTDGAYLHYITGSAPTVAPPPPPSAVEQPAKVQTAWAGLIDFLPATVHRTRDDVKSLADDLVNVFRG